MVSHLCVVLPPPPPPPPRGPECQVLDYQTQQMKLLPLIASTYALMQTGQYMMRHYAQGRSEISQGNLEVMPEVGVVGWAWLRVTFGLCFAAPCHKFWTESI